MPKKPVLKIIPTIHKVVPTLLEQRINVALIGCGGNGSQMLTKLARLHYALCETGHPGGLKVYAFDADKATHANVGRQMFSPSDVGLHKAVVLVNRINAFFGLDWEARPENFKDGIEHDASDTFGRGWRTSSPIHLVVSCVDSARARRSIERSFQRGFMNMPEYWLDLGNTRDTGQVILGQPENGLASRVLSSESVRKHGTRDSGRETARLPTVLDIFPELRNPKFKEDEQPSCSLAEALEKQSLFVNDHITSWAAQLLDQLLRVGQLEHQGYFINLGSGQVNPLPVPRAEAQAAARAA